MLFIDSNMYLEFFKSSQPQLQKLLPAIESSKNELFVTSQIANEVTRSKLRVASASFGNYISDYKLHTARLPEHLESATEDSVKNWHKKSAQLQKDFKESRESLGQIVEKLLTSIMKGEDSASVSFAKIFRDALFPTVDELEKARLRKELGNPPGKPGDPLGDEVSWEQLLSAYTGKAPLWIISADNDYSIKIEKKRFFNAYLLEEVKRSLGKTPTIYIFESLAEGIKHFSANSGTTISNLPSDHELERIASEEKISHDKWIRHHGFPDPIACVHCSETLGFSGPIPRPSIYGGWSYQWMCNVCQEWNDFGEPYDE